MLAEADPGPDHEALVPLLEQLAGLMYELNQNEEFREFTDWATEIRLWSRVEAGAVAS